MNTSPLSNKLGLKRALRVLLINPPDNIASLLSPPEPGSTFETEAHGIYDAVLFFAKSAADLQETSKWLGSHLRPETILWIAYPKKKSGIETDIGMMRAWPAIQDMGYDPVLAVSFDDKWTGLRFKPVDQIKRSTVSNTGIAGSELADFIDVANRIVRLPDNLLTELEGHPAAKVFFDKLSFTNKKEYAVWLLGAKQEKTRNERRANFVTKLLEGKRNPSEK